MAETSELSGSRAEVAFKLLEQHLRAIEGDGGVQIKADLDKYLGLYAKCYWAAGGGDPKAGAAEVRVIE